MLFSAGDPGSRRLAPSGKWEPPLANIQTPSGLYRGAAQPEPQSDCTALPSLESAAGMGYWRMTLLTLTGLH
ncbi:hypothetical protein PCASD_19676, partial [Puccinia coronata f. sp. avenae]